MERRAARLASAGVAVLAGLALIACSDGAGSPSPTAPPSGETTVPAYGGPGELMSIQSTTQLHLDGLAIGAGNIWEEDYVLANGESRRGLTGLLFFTIAADPSRNFVVRVHPGQDVDAPGYRLHVVAVEETRVHFTVERLSQ